MKKKLMELWNMRNICFILFICPYNFKKTSNFMLIFSLEIVNVNGNLIQDSEEN